MRLKAAVPAAKNAGLILLNFSFIGRAPHSIERWMRNQAVLLLLLSTLRAPENSRLGNLPAYDLFQTLQALARQLGLAHEIEVDRAGCLPTFADGPDDQRLTFADVAGGIDLGERCAVIVGVGADVGPAVAGDVDLLQEAALVRPGKADSDQDEIGADGEFAAGQRPAAGIDPGTADADGAAVLVADHLEGGAGKLTLGALGPAGRGAEVGRPIRPY